MAESISRSKSDFATVWFEKARVERRPYMASFNSIVLMSIARSKRANLDASGGSVVR
jgi:hypothetical protein